jgi:hypothetical protein
VRFFSLNKGQSATIITLLVMVFLGACYFFIYIPANEKNVQGQRFRSLQNIDKNIHTKIDNSIAMLNLLIKAYHDEKDPKDTITGYIANYLTENFKLTKPVFLPKVVLTNRDSIDFYNIQVNNSTGKISLVTQKTIIAPPAIQYASTDTAVYQMAMLFQIEQFIKMLLPSNVFDEYIIFSKGQPVYETFPSGISSVKNDSLLSIKNGVSGSVMHNYNVSGTDYKMFLQPVIFGNNEWIIAGLLTDKRYNEEKNQLPAQVVLFLVTIVLITVLSFPWLKLYQMGSKDRLTLADAVSTVVISMLLVSLMFFMFFKYNVPFRTINEPKEKSKLAAGIIKAFNRERDSAYHTLKGLDSLVDKAPHDIIDLGKQAMTFKNHDSIPVAQKIKGIAAGLAIRQLYWLNAKGDEEINWNSDTVNGPHGNFINRPYFNVIQSGRPYLLNDSLTQPYYFDQLVSRTTSAFTTVISIPSTARLNDPGHYVAGMSFVVKSLQQVILPTGFQFAMIDNSGKVLYHSDVSKCLNENLLTEFSESDKLKSCLVARSEGFFSTGYFSNDYYVHVRAISGLPYFIVIFEDTGFKETRDMEVYSFTFSCMLLFFGFMIVQMLVTFIVSSRRSFFKKQGFNTSWISPKMSAHRQYNLAIIANASIILLLLVFYHFASFLLYCYMLLFSVTFLSLFLNSVFAKRYKGLKPANYSYKLSSLRWLFICIFLVDLLAVITLQAGHFFLLLLFELIAFAIGIFLFTRGDNVLNEARKPAPALLTNRYKYIHSFTLMAFTRLIVSSGIPVMFFYITAYNYEQNLDIRYKQLQFAQNVVSKLDTTQLQTIQNGLHYQSGVYFDSSWVKTAKIVSKDSIDGVARPYSLEDRRALYLLNLFRLHITDKAINDDKFYMPASADSTFYHNHLLKDACSDDCGTITAVQTKTPGKYLQVASADLNYHFPGIFCSQSYCRGILYWLLLFGGLALFYFILLNIIEKIFSLNIPDLTRWQDLDNEILERSLLNNLVFVIGLPGSGKLTRILEKIESKAIVTRTGEPYVYDKNSDAASNVFIADLMNIPDAGDERSNDAEWKFYSKKIFNSKNRLVIINHFEYNIQDAYTTRIKLNLLESIMVQNTCRVIILSTIHPVAFLDSVLDHAFKGHPVPGQDLERWHVLLGHFRIVVFPLEERKEEGIQSRVEQAISYETKRTHFLNKMQEATVKVATSMSLKYSEDRESDELALKLQMTAHYFYMYIWQSLTKEEKFLLYDHAEDNLVNSFDDYNLNMLICKGILIRSDGALRIFNNGFRNFILTAIGNIEAMKIKSQIKDNGNWNKLKNPMLIIILAIMVFLIASQQEAYSKLITYAAALATGIPAVMKIFSLFDGTKEKSA